MGVRGEPLGVYRGDQAAGAAGECSLRASTTDIDEVLGAIAEFGKEREQMPYATTGWWCAWIRLQLTEPAGADIEEPAVGVRTSISGAEDDEVDTGGCAGGKGRGRSRRGRCWSRWCWRGRRCSTRRLHNYGRVRDARMEPDREDSPTTDIRIGDTVYVEKAGEVIPYVAGVCVEKVERGAKKISLPARARVRGPVEVEPPEAEENPKLETARRCVNPGASAGAGEVDLVRGSEADGH